MQSRLISVFGLVREPASFSSLHVVSTPCWLTPSCFTWPSRLHSLSDSISTAIITPLGVVCNGDHRTLDTHTLRHFLFPFISPLHSCNLLILCLAVWSYHIRHGDPLAMICFAYESIMMTYFATFICPLCPLGLFLHVLSFEYPFCLRLLSCGCPEL